MVFQINIIMNRLINLSTLLLPVFLLSSLVGVTGQETIPVFLKPDPASYRVTTLPTNDERLDQAAAMPYSTGQEKVWKWLELHQTFIGHVRKTYVTKGLSVQVGAPVYFVPGEEDAFLTILEDGNRAEVIEVVGDWVKISIEASIPVYFETDTPASTVTATPVFDPEIPSESAESNYEVEPAVAMDEPVLDDPVDLSPSNPYPGEPIDRIMEGRLVAYKPFFSNPWKKPAYKWEIINRGKKRMAFVDPSGLILDRPIESYAGKQVSLSGSIYQINNGRDLVIVPNQLTVQ